MIKKSSVIAVTTISALTLQMFLATPNFSVNASDSEKEVTESEKETNKTENNTEQEGKDKENDGENKDENREDDKEEDEDKPSDTEKPKEEKENDKPNIEINGDTYPEEFWEHKVDVDYNKQIIKNNELYEKYLNDPTEENYNEFLMNYIETPFHMQVESSQKLESFKEYYQKSKNKKKFLDDVLNLEMLKGAKYYKESLLGVVEMDIVEVIEIDVIQEFIYKTEDMKYLTKAEVEKLIEIYNELIAIEYREYKKQNPDAEILVPSDKEDLNTSEGSNTPPDGAIEPPNMSNQWPSSKPNHVTPNYKPKPPMKLPPLNNGYQKNKVKYHMVGGSCKVTTQYLNQGKIVKTDTRNATASESRHCISFSNVSAKEYTKKQAAEKSKFRGVNYYDKTVRDKLRKEMGVVSANGTNNVDTLDQKSDKLSGITIQYTLNKNEESPYYHDTGVNILEGNHMNYEIASNTLHTIAVKSKGKFFKDSDKVLAVIEGQVIRIYEFEGEIKFEDFANHFLLSNIGVEVQDSRSGKKSAVADLIETNTLDKFYVFDKKVEFTDQFIIQGSTPLLPAQTLIEALGGSVVVNGDSVEANLDGKEYKYTVGKDVAVVAGNTRDLVVEVKKNSKNTIMIPTNELFGVLGLEMIVDNKDVYVEKSKSSDENKDKIKDK